VDVESQVVHLSIQTWKKESLHRQIKVIGMGSMVSLKKIYYGYLTLFKRYFGLTTERENYIADFRKTICNSCEVQSIIPIIGLDYCDRSKGGCSCIGVAKRHCIDCECPFKKW
jgi:hypothetical protein